MTKGLVLAMFGAIHRLNKGQLIICAHDVGIHHLGVLRATPMDVGEIDSTTVDLVYRIIMQLPSTINLNNLFM